MNQNDKTALTLADFGTAELRVERAVAQIRAGGGVIVVDDEDRENEGDIVFAAETISPQQMNLLIRACTGIVCLVLTDERAETSRSSSSAVGCVGARAASAGTSPPTISRAIASAVVSPVR